MTRWWASVATTENGIRSISSPSEVHGVKRSYQDSRHVSTNESDCGKGKELENTYDEQSDESDYNPS